MMPCTFSRNLWDSRFGWHLRSESRRPEGGRVDLPPLTWRESIDANPADRSAYEAQGRVAHPRRHTPNLTVLSFPQSEFNPARRYAKSMPDRRVPRPKISGLTDQSCACGERREVT